MGYGPIVTFTFGVFFKLLNQEFGWSRGDISQAFSISLFVMSLVFPFVGRLVDRFGARKVIIPSILLFGLGLMSLSLLSAKIWQLYAVYILLGLVGGGTAPVPYSNVLSHWFDKRRGLALGIAMVGLGLGAFVMPSLAQMLIVPQGWRQAYIVFGLMVMVITIPIVGLFFKETPEMVGLRPDGDVINPNHPNTSEQKIGLSAQARQTHTFWILVGAFFLMSASVHELLIHLVPLLTDRGISPQLAAGATSLFGAAFYFLDGLGQGISLIISLHPLSRYVFSVEPHSDCYCCGAALQERPRSLPPFSSVSAWERRETLLPISSVAILVSAHLVRFTVTPSAHSH